MKILVADDYKQSRIQLENILLGLGHDVISAKDGKEALGLYKENEVEMAFIDWTMPKMDGIEVCKNIQTVNSKTYRESYIILVTAKAKKRNMVEGLEAGADDFTLKPYTKEAIASRIDVAKRVLETKPTKVEIEACEPLKCLENEHKLIHRMTGVLEVVSNMLDEEIPLPKKLLNWCTSSAFILNFQLHERKEEYYINLFIVRAKDAHGQASKLYTRSSLSQIMKEHLLIKKLLYDMQKMMKTYDIDRKKDVAMLKQAINRYIPLIRLHAAREDDVFFPFTERYLTNEDMKQLTVDFDGVEREVGIEKIKTRMEAMGRLENILKIRD